jgi:hypothetical protein
MSSLKTGAALALALLAACAPSAPEPVNRAVLVDVTEASGIAFRHEHGSTGNRELPETMGGGVGLLDFDSDGDLDAYFVQSGPLREIDGSESRAGGENELWSNAGDGRFELAPRAAGADDAGYGMGCTVGDADGDGDDDLFVLNWGPNVLFENRDGQFSDATDEMGITTTDVWSVSAAFFDAEGDGDLDLYVVNYLACPPRSHLDTNLNHRAPAGFLSYPTPDVFDACPDRVFENQGESESGPRFIDQTVGAGVGALHGKGMAVVPTDVDLDGIPELYVANDGTPNFLLTFSEGVLVDRGPEACVAFNEVGLTEGGMGVDTGDVDGDLDLDLFVTNFANETNSLYLNQAGVPVRFRDRTRQAGLVEPSRLLVGFGTLLDDFDLDSDLDLFVGNGHVFDNVYLIHDERTHAQSNQLLENQGDGRFRLAQELLDPGGEPGVTRGCALGDVDGDGFPDIVVVNSDGPCQVLRGMPLQGAGDSDRAWVRIALVGPKGNPRGLGANLWLHLAGGEVLLRRIECARSYASSSEPVITTGLPSELAAIEVMWPGGRRERFEADFGRNVVLRLGEGSPLD